MIDRTISCEESDYESNSGRDVRSRTRVDFVGGSQGLLEGRIVGGVAGHMAGHGKLGAAAGCAIGHHQASKQNPNNSNAQAPAPQK